MISRYPITVRGKSICSGQFETEQHIPNLGKIANTAELLVQDYVPSCRCIC